MVNFIKKNCTAIYGLLISLPAAAVIYFFSYAVIRSDPVIVLILVAGLIMPFFSIGIVFWFRYKKIKQYKNFDPNSKLPQCIVSSTSAIISGLGIGSSLTGNIDTATFFNIISILLLGSFTILGIADGYGEFTDNPDNKDNIRNMNNDLQNKRTIIFMADVFLCLLLPFFAAISVAYIR